MPGQSPEEIAAAAMREFYTLRPADEPPGNPLERIRPWLHESMIARITAPESGRGGSPRWERWAAEGARVDAATFVSAERPPREAPGTAQRKVAVTQSVIGPDSHSEALPGFAVAVTLRDTGGGWRVVDYRSW